MTRDEELAQLIAEQQSDDTHIVRPEFRGSVSLDAEFGTDNGDPVSFSNILGVDMEGERVSFFKHSRGDILNGSASYHGTEDGYSNQGCRCDRCKRAHAANFARWKSNHVKKGYVPERAHGTQGGYGNYNCRCDRCKEAHVRAFRERQNRLLGPITQKVCANEKCGKSFMPHKRGVIYCSFECKSKACQRNWRRKQRAEVRARAA